MNIGQAIFSQLPKHTQKIIVIVLVVVFIVIWLINTIQDNEMQKKVNHQLLSNQSVNLNLLLPNTKMICVVPNGSFIYKDSTNIDEYLSKYRLKSLNRTINSIWKAMSNDWHLVGVDKESYELYRMGDMVTPDFYGAKCYTKEHNKSLMLIPNKENYGKTFVFANSEN